MPYAGRFARSGASLKCPKALGCLKWLWHGKGETAVPWGLPGLIQRFGTLASGLAEAPRARSGGRARSPAPRRSEAPEARPRGESRGGGAAAARMAPRDPPEALPLSP